MRQAHSGVATLTVGLVAAVALAACGSAAPHMENALRAGTAYAAQTYSIIGVATSTWGSGEAAPTKTTSSGTVTVAKLAGTTRERASIGVNFACSPVGPTCRWSSEASQIGAAICPEALDAAQSIWAGPDEPIPGTERASFTFQPMRGVARPRVCVYVND